VKELLDAISRTISEQTFERARELLAGLVDILGDNDPEVTRIRTLLDFVEGKD
jgi:hypothetical protein